MMTGDFFEMTQSGVVEDWKEILSKVTNGLSSLSLKVLEYFIYYMNFCKAFFSFLNHFLRAIMMEKLLILEMLSNSTMNLQCKNA